MRAAARLLFIALATFAVPTLAQQTAPSPLPLATPREDALDPTPAGNPPDPDVDLFLNDWRNATPRVAFDTLVVHDILTKLDSNDPVRPARRGAVLTEITSISYATLAPGAKASGRVRPGERQIFYTSAGRGQLAVNARTIPVREGIGFTLTPGYDFTLTNDGKDPLVFYVRTEPLPTDAKASADIVVVDRRDADRRVGAHWMHICNGGPAGMTLCTIAPYTMPQPHSHAGEEAWLLVKGESVLMLGKTLVRMHPGQAYRIPPTGLAAHSNLNLGSEPIQMIYMGPAVRTPGPPQADFARLDNSPIAPSTAPDIDMFTASWRDAYPRIAHGNLYMRDMLTALQGADALHPTRTGAVLVNANAVSYAMLEPGSTAHRVEGELDGVQETFVVVSGTGFIGAGAERIELAKGMSFIVTPDLDFRLTATGDEYLTFFVVAEKLVAGTPARSGLKIIDRRAAPPVPAAWHDRERPVITRADGLSRYTAIDQIEQAPMTIARPSSAAATVEEIWIALDDVDMLFGKQLRKVPAGTAYKLPPTGITAHANINLSTRPTHFLRIRN